MRDDGRRDSNQQQAFVVLDGPIPLVFDVPAGHRLRAQNPDNDVGCCQPLIDLVRPVSTNWNVVFVHPGRHTRCGEVGTHLACDIRIRTLIRDEDPVRFGHQDATSNWCCSVVTRSSVGVASRGSQIERTSARSARA